MHFKKYLPKLLARYFELPHFFTLKLVQSLIVPNLHAFKLIKIYLVLIIIILLFNLHLYFEFHHIHPPLVLNDFNYLRCFHLFDIITIFITILLILNHHHK